MMLFYPIFFHLGGLAPFFILQAFLWKCKRDSDVSIMQQLLCILKKINSKADIDGIT